MAKDRDPLRDETVTKHMAEYLRRRQAITEAIDRSLAKGGRAEEAP